MRKPTFSATPEHCPVSGWAHLEGDISQAPDARVGVYGVEKWKGHWRPGQAADLFEEL